MNFTLVYLYLPSKLVLPKQAVHAHITCPMYATRPIHPILLDMKLKWPTAGMDMVTELTIFVPNKSRTLDSLFRSQSLLRVTFHTQFKATIRLLRLICQLLGKKAPKPSLCILRTVFNVN